MVGVRGRVRVKARDRAGVRARVRAMFRVRVRVWGRVRVWDMVRARPGAHACCSGGGARRCKLWARQVQNFLSARQLAA